jgi:lauroyl/myristoyl acyltransferase
MRLVPARHRFSLAARLAGSLAVPMRATWVFSGLRRGLRLNSEQDLSLHLLLRSMTASGTAFDVPLRLVGEEVLEAALSSGRGTVIVAPHALLSRLLLRHLYDRGLWPTVIGGMNGIPLAGTRAVVQTVYPTSNVLLLARTRLREGGIVCANVDHVGGRDTKNKVSFATPVGEVHLSDSIFRLAIRCGAQVVFTFARAEPTGVRQWLAAPRSSSAGSPEAVAGDFVAFVQEHAAYLS